MVKFLHYLKLELIKLVSEFIEGIILLKISQIAGVSKTRFGKGAMNDLKSQSMNDKNRLVELMVMNYFRAFFS